MHEKTSKVKLDSCTYIQFELWRIYFCIQESFIMPTYNTIFLTKKITHTLYTSKGYFVLKKQL